MKPRIHALAAALAVACAFAGSPAAQAQSRTGILDTIRNTVQGNGQGQYSGDQLGRILQNMLNNSAQSGSNSDITSLNGLTSLSVAGPISTPTKGITCVGSTCTPDFGQSNFFTITLTGNVTIANPLNAVAGQSGCFDIIQGGSGSYTVTWGANFKWSGAQSPVLTTTVGAEDDVCYWVVSSSKLHANSVNDLR